MKLYSQIKDTLFSLFSKKTIGARILLIREDHILLVRHTYTEGWYTIGGGVEGGESPMHTVWREVHEEVGVTLKHSPKLFSIYHRPRKRGDDYVVLYIGEPHQEQESNSIEIAEKKWFPLSDLPHTISPATRRRIEEYLGHRSISDKW
jgi:ADP-ribose pyrophosphatase YjhB (NUDIX family)